MVRQSKTADGFSVSWSGRKTHSLVQNSVMSVPPQRKIVAFHQDGHGDWVADLECGHTQHVRHNPPWQNRPWAITTEGRSAQLGKELPCKKCAEEISFAAGAG